MSKYFPVETFHTVAKKFPESTEFQKWRVWFAQLSFLSQNAEKKQNFTQDLYSFPEHLDITFPSFQMPLAWWDDMHGYHKYFHVLPHYPSF